LKVSEGNFVWKALVQLSVFRACLPKASEGMAFVASNPFFSLPTHKGHAFAEASAGKHKEAQSLENKIC
jgi:hypothetical protein